jgi:hypothetical protein
MDGKRRIYVKTYEDEDRKELVSADLIYRKAVSDSRARWASYPRAVTEPVK